jgi:hypothetical protein
MKLPKVLTSTIHHEADGSEEKHLLVFVIRPCNCSSSFELTKFEKSKNSMSENDFSQLAVKPEKRSQTKI